MYDLTFSLSTPDINLHSGTTRDIRAYFYGVKILCIIGDTEWAEGLVEGAFHALLRSKVGKDLIFL